jgi:hypothetical protein
MPTQCRANEEGYGIAEGPSVGGCSAAGIATTLTERSEVPPVSALLHCLLRD